MMTLNMDIDVADQAVRRMETAYATITEQAKRIRVQIYDVLQDSGNWSGLSAKDFFNKFNDLDLNIDANLRDFGNDVAILKAEVEQWKAMQEHLNGHGTM